MSTWRAASAKAKFSSLLDEAESEGPQLIRRRKQDFILTTPAELDRRLEEARTGKRVKFLSAWEALRPPKEALLDEDEFEEFTKILQELRQ